MISQRAQASFRAARQSDGPALLELAADLASSAVVEPAPFATVLDRIMSDERQCLLVAEVSDSLVGYVHAVIHPAFHANGMVAWVEEIYVAPDSRQAGVGRALMSHMESWAKQSGAVYVSLATRRAEHFYSALGYNPSATYFKRGLPL